MIIIRRTYIALSVALGSATLFAVAIAACSSSSGSLAKGTDGGQSTADAHSVDGHSVVKRDATGKPSVDGGGGGGGGDTGVGGFDATTGYDTSYQLGDAGPLNDAIVTSGPHATVRVADFADPRSFFLDYCLSTDPLSSTTKWVGPLLKGSYQFLAVDDSDSITQMSPYFDVAVNTQAIRFVLFDTADCNEVLEGIPDFSLKTPLAEGTRTTIALAGTGFDAGGLPLQVFEYPDIVEPADGGNMVRFVNLSQAASPMDIFAYSGYGMKTPCTLLYNDIPFGGVGVATDKIPGDGGPTAANGYTPLRGENLYDLCFQSYTMAFVKHGGSCTMPFTTIYSTDYAFSEGAWTFYMFDDNYDRVICRDDGTSNPLCEHH